ncbi:zinc ribbon domain-containing protein [Calidithermus chliarophilus]|uniref:zinc ribbon domain-containing protein n=1 Tax=Calidithermus chliarophilus TaxID=52023 RepID=UPI0003FE8179|nr:zinc ribbon domain-containing protein [Calidithermus chliarophilus]
MEEAWGVFYRICPRCARAVPLASSERYCTNDGTRLLEACPGCGARITSPYARFCGRCGREFRLEARAFEDKARQGGLG